MPLEGLQLSFLPQVDGYELANPPSLGVTAGRLGSIGCEQVADSSDSEETVLGGQLGLNWADVEAIDPLSSDCSIDRVAEPVGAVEADAPLALKFETKARGWIREKVTERPRKNRDPWICRQAWLYWEEPGGKKRSRYIPKGKLAAVKESVYGMRRSIVETLELLGAGTIQP